MVEVRDVSRRTLYWSGPEDADKKADPKVLVIYGDPSITELQITKRSFVIRSGELLIRDDKRQEHTSGDLFSYGRVPWSSLLQDTFGKLMRDLIGGGLTTLWGTALGCAAQIFTSIVTEDRDLSHDAHAKYHQGWAYINSFSHGRGFINTIRRYLPDLTESKRMMDAMELTSACTYIEAVGKYEQVIHMIAAACSCSKCKGATNGVLESSPSSNQTFCQIVLVEVISELVQIISSLSAPATVYPVRSGVEDLYWNRAQPNQTLEQRDFVYKGFLRYQSRSILISAKDLFTGRSEKYVIRNHSAKASDGLCFCTDTLLNVSANQEQCNRLQVIPGRTE